MRAPRATAGVLVALACAAAAAGCGSGGGASSTTRSATVPRGTPRVLDARGKTIPGQIDPNPQGFFPRDVINPLVNAWRTSSSRRFTEVDAGAEQVDHTVGVLGIFRGRSRGGAQRGTLVKVIGSGPLRIVAAPLGTSATAAQGDARIRFVGATGIHGTLSLSDDKVQLHP